MGRVFTRFAAPFPCLFFGLCKQWSSLHSDTWVLQGARIVPASYTIPLVVVACRDAERLAHNQHHVFRGTLAVLAAREGALADEMLAGILDPEEPDVLDASASGAHLHHTDGTAQEQHDLFARAHLVHGGQRQRGFDTDDVHFVRSEKLIAKLGQIEQPARSRFANNAQVPGRDERMLGTGITKTDPGARCNVEAGDERFNGQQFRALVRLH